MTTHTHASKNVALTQDSTDQALNTEEIVPQSIESDAIAIQSKNATSQPLVTPSSLSDTYQFECEIGRGSQGKIFRARRLYDQKCVVIKQLNIHAIKSWKEYELFHREAQTLQSLKLPGVAQFYEAIDCLDDTPPCSYIIQEYIQGHSLQQMLNDGHRFRTEDIFDILIQTLQIIEALHAHEPPVIHRDIKPSNLMITSDSSDKFHVTIIDFGAVANPNVQSHGSTMAGTYGYMPPEQLMGNPVPASDIYAVAALAVQLFTGKSPSSLPVKDFNLIFEPEMQNEPYALVTTLRQMLAPRVDNRLVDTATIIHRLQEFQLGHYDISLDNPSAYSYDYEHALRDIDSAFSPGSIQLWKDLPDATPRPIPSIYKAISEHNPTKFPHIQLSSLWQDIADFIDSHRLILQTIKYSLNAFLYSLLICLMLFLSLLNISAFIYFLFNIIISVVLATILGVLDYFTQKESYLDIIKRNPPKMKFPINYDEIQMILKQGRKTIATVTDIQYQPLKDDVIDWDYNEYDEQARIMPNLNQATPTFIIHYRFNPPDDVRREDIIHTYTCHDIPDNLTLGTPLPILYRIINHSLSDTVISMPFPMPIADINSQELKHIVSQSNSPLNFHLLDVTTKDAEINDIIQKLTHVKDIAELVTFIIDIPKAFDSELCSHDWKAILKIYHFYLSTDYPILHNACLESIYQLLRIVKQNEYYNIIFTQMLPEMLYDFLSNPKQTTLKKDHEIMAKIEQIIKEIQNQTKS